MSRTRLPAFTLAELLITLAILGVITTFTIPKVLQSQQDERWNSAAKEAAGAVYGAYQEHARAGLLSTSTRPDEFTPYLNYVTVKTSGQIDDTQTDTFFNCSSGSLVCILMHNGGVLRFPTNQWFNGTGSTNAIAFHYDPDGTYSGTTDGPGKAVGFFLYYNGRISERGSIPAGTTNNLTSYPAAPAKTPPWFHW